MVALPHEADLVSSATDSALIIFFTLCTASKFMIDTGAGVVDADYRGTLYVLLFNHSDKEFKGDGL